MIQKNICNWNAIENPQGKRLDLMYETQALPMGITVAEYERHFNLPRYSVYPSARDVGPADKGAFMYNIPTDHGMRLNCMQSAINGLHGRPCKKLKPVQKPHETPMAAMPALSQRPHGLPRSLYLLRRTDGG